MNNNLAEEEMASTSAEPAAIPQDSKNIALLTWIGTIFLGFIPGLLFYLLKSDNDFVKDHSKEALNWSITTIFGYIVSFILAIVAIGALLVPIIMICNLVFCILGAVAASKGETYRCPFAVRLIK